MKVDSNYEKGYHAERHKHLIADDEYFWARAEAQVDLYFSAAEKNLRVFEYGCGIGQGIAKLPNAAGWDISGEARQVCKLRRIPVYDDLNDVPKGAWDIVFCRHALEHMEAPLDALRTMRTLLKTEGGEMLLVLPKERHQPSDMAPDLNQHLYAFNFRCINNLLARAEFVPYKNEYRYVLGYRVLLPVRKIFGASAYFWATMIVGRAKNNGELVIRARLA